MIPRKSFTLAIAPLLSLALFASAASAQAVPHQNVVQFNPFGIFTEYYTGEYERTVSASGTFGVAATHIRDGEYFRWTSTDVKLRFYPNATPLKGFSFGATAGFLRYADAENVFNGTAVRQEDSSPTVGLEVSYQWLIGVQDNFVVALGLGAKRLITGLDVYDAPEDATAYLRFNVGYAF